MVFAAVIHYEATSTTPSAATVVAAPVTASVPLAAARPHAASAAGVTHEVAAPIQTIDVTALPQAPATGYAQDTAQPPSRHSARGYGRR
jgi:hypothetical protein